MRAISAIAIAVLIGVAVLRASVHGPLGYSGSGFTSSWTKRFFAGACVLWGLGLCCLAPTSMIGLPLGILIGAIGVLAFLSPDRQVSSDVGQPRDPDRESSDNSAGPDGEGQGDRKD